jgi:hypothetical protein
MYVVFVSRESSQNSDTAIKKQQITEEHYLIPAV